MIHLLLLLLFIIIKEVERQCKEYGHRIWVTKMGYEEVLAVKLYL